MTLLRRRLVVLNQWPPEMQLLNPATARRIRFQRHKQSVRVLNRKEDNQTSKSWKRSEARQREYNRRGAQDSGVGEGAVPLEPGGAGPGF